MRYVTRHARLRRQPARPEMAGRRACRRAVRRQLRGGRREQHPARRRRLGSLPVGDRRRRSPGPASATGTWNRSTNTAPAPASGGCTACSPRRKVPVTVYGVATALARSPDQVAAMQEAGWEIARHGLKWIDYRDHADRGRAPRHRRGDPPPHRGDRRAPDRLVHRPHARSTRSSWPPRKAASTTSPTPMTTTCPTGRRRTARPRRSSSSPTRSTPTTCASPRRRASIPATSSSPI